MKISICPFCDEPECLDNCIFKASSWFILFGKYSLTRKDAAIVLTIIFTIIISVNAVVSNQVPLLFGGGMVPQLFILLGVSTAISLTLANIFGVNRPEKDPDKKSR